MSLLFSLVERGSLDRLIPSLIHPFHCWLRFIPGFNSDINVRKVLSLGPGPPLFTIPVSLLDFPFHCWFPVPEHFLNRNPGFVKSAQKTLEWSTICSLSAKIVSFENPRFYTFYSEMLTSGIPGFTLLTTFNQKPDPGRGYPPTVKRVYKGGSGHLGGSESTSGGVDTFCSSLCRGAFCAGFLCPFSPVSSGRRVYSEGERPPFPPRRGLSLLTTRE